MTFVLCLPSPALGASSPSLRGGRHQEDTSATGSKEALSASESPPDPLTEHEKFLDLNNASNSSIRTLRGLTAACPNWCKTHHTYWSFCKNGEEAAGKCHSFKDCRGCAQCEDILSNPCSNRDKYSATCQPWCSKKSLPDKCSFDKCSGCNDCNSYGGSQSERQKKYNCPDNVGNPFPFFDAWPKGRDCSCCNYYNLHDKRDCCVKMKYFKNP